MLFYKTQHFFSERKPMWNTLTKEQLNRIPRLYETENIPAWEIAVDAGLKYVIAGNVPGHEYNSTCCPKY